MDAEDIIHAIHEAERRKTVLYRGFRGDMSLQADSKNWNLLLVNDPKLHFNTLVLKFENSVLGYFKFKMPCIQEAQSISKDIFDFLELPNKEVLALSDLNLNQPIYLVVYMLKSNKLEAVY